MMKKKLFTRALMGFPIGIAVSYLITILISVSLGATEYAPCVPELAIRMGGEMHAVVLQAVFSGILGAVLAAASVIWEIEDWSIAKQTGVYFGVVSAAMLPTAYLNYWMEHSLKGVLVYIGIFMLIFIVVWTAQYFFWKRKIEKLNRGINRKG